MPETKKLVVVLARSASRFLPDDVRIGWRITCQNGDLYDRMWGSTRPEHLDRLLENVRKEYGEFELVDVRNVEDGLRDGEYWKRHLT
jgi:hypothetical protein